MNLQFSRLPPASLFVIDCRVNWLYCPFTKSVRHWISVPRNGMFNRSTEFQFCTNFQRTTSRGTVIQCLILTLVNVLHCRVRPVADNGEAAWRRRGGHNRSLEPQTVNSTQKVIRSYTPACAKPLVIGSHSTYFTLFSVLFFLFFLVHCRVCKSLSTTRYVSELIVGLYSTLGYSKLELELLIFRT